MATIDYAHLDKTTIACPCCGATDFVPAVRGDRYGFGLQTVVCRDCSLIFTNPRPAADWFETFYRHHYRDYYFAMKSPGDSYIASQWANQRHEANIESIREFLPASGRLLDVGAAEGSFLRIFLATLSGWSAQGVELTEDYAAYAAEVESLDIVNADMETVLDWPAAGYDLLTANHVLEHLLDPNLFLRAARHLLRPGGLIFIDVPDAEGESHGIQNLHIAHLFHFSRLSLENFLRKHGFVPVRWGRYGSPPWTLQVLARRDDQVPLQFVPSAQSAETVAAEFARHCRKRLHLRHSLSKTFLGTWYRAIKRIIVT